MTKKGATRYVFLWFSWAIKIPSFHSWKHFLWGLLANMQEREFSATGWPELCPIEFSIPGGWLVIMPRATPLFDHEWESVRADWAERGDYTVPVEMKQDSFGILDGKLVVVDYGS